MFIQSYGQKEKYRFESMRWLRNDCEVCGECDLNKATFLEYLRGTTGTISTVRHCGQPLYIGTREHLILSNLAISAKRHRTIKLLYTYLKTRLSYLI